MNIKFIRLFEYPEGPNLDFLHLPPIAIAIFKAFLNKSHFVELDDLGIRLIHDYQLLQEIVSLGIQDKIVDDYLANNKKKHRQGL